MNEQRIKEIFSEYGRSRGEKGAAAESFDSEKLCYVKAWLMYLSKEARIIVYALLVNGNDEHYAVEDLKKRWGEAGNRTEHEVAKILNRAIRDIDIFMKTYFPTKNA